MTTDNTPTVSVVVCAYDEERLLGSCLRGLAEQTYPSDRYEVIIIDDESTDKTPHIAREFIETLSLKDTAFTLARITHGGLSVARNAGIQIAKGEIIAYIDGDAIAAPTWLEELVKPIQDGADYVGGRINLLNTESWLARFLQRSRHRQYFGPKVFNRLFIGCNMAYRRDVFDTAGGFQENFVARGDETNLHLRIHHKYRYAPAPNAVVLHERPTTLKAALAPEWKSATLGHLAARAARSPLTVKKGLITTEQVLVMVFPILLCLVWFWQSYLAIPLLLSMAAVVRRMFLQPVARSVIRDLIKDYGIIRGLAGHLLSCYLLDVFAFLGAIVGVYRHWNTPILPPMTTPLTILSTVDNRANQINLPG